MDKNKELEIMIETLIRAFALLISAICVLIGWIHYGFPDTIEIRMLQGISMATGYVVCKDFLTLMYKWHKAQNVNE